MVKRRTRHPFLQAGLVLLRVLGAVWLLLLLALWALQETLIFHPPVSAGTWPRERRSLEGTVERMEVAARDGTVLRGWFVKGRGAGQRPTLIYFGGNAEEVGRRVGLHEDLHRDGWSLALIARRGYGPSDGDPDVGMLGPDAVAVSEAVLGREDVDRDGIVLWGSSLGCGPALLAAAELGERVRGLVLFAPWTSIADIGQSQYPIFPVSWLLRADVPAAQAAPRVRASVLAVHGTADAIIPYELGWNIASLLPADVGTRFVTLPGIGHSFSLANAEVGTAFHEFLAEVLR